LNYRPIRNPQSPIHNREGIMPTWDADLYLRFANERTQPAIDLLARVGLDAPRRVIDLGCGPGNSTALLRGRWPEAAITGLDNSPEMIAAARRDGPEGEWVLGDIATWTAEEPYDLVFSNATLQWLPDHGALYPRLFAQVAPGGAFAVQIPVFHTTALQRVLLALADEPAWRERLGPATRALVAESPGFYYDALVSQAARVDLWETEYQHVLAGPDAIVEWISGTRLRPYLEALGDDADRRDFLARLRAGIADLYRPQRDCRVLFPFRRLFLVAYR
jgi:trans-aconitate 2-methyltransferase